MESSQLRRISIIGISLLCLSPVDFFSNKLFVNKMEETSKIVIATNSLKLGPNYLSNNYEIFNPNIITASNKVEKLASENKKKGISDSENNLESKTTNEKENNKDKNSKEKKNKEETEVVIEKEEENTSAIEVETPVETIATVTEEVKPVEYKNETVVQAQPAAKPNTDVATSLVNYALQFVGNPYSYGGSDLYNGTDCSGFTMRIFENFGYSLPHQADSQSYLGSYVSLDSLEPGDLIFYGYDGYICHVAIYIGNGKIVHAATSSQGIVTSDYQIMPIITARRILN